MNEPKDDNATSAVAQRVSSTERSCRHREREREGVTLLSIEIGKAQVDALVATGVLDPGKVDDRAALTEAVTRFLDRDGAATQEPERRGYATFVIPFDDAEMDYLAVAARGTDLDPVMVTRLVRNLVADARSRYLLNNASIPRRGSRAYSPSEAEQTQIHEQAAAWAAAQRTVPPKRRMDIAVQRLWLMGFLRSGGRKWAGQSEGLPWPGELGSPISKEALAAFGLGHLHDQGRIEVERAEPESSSNDPFEDWRDPAVGATQFWR